MLVAPSPGPLEGELATSAVSLGALHSGVLVARSDGVRAERLRRLAILERPLSPLPVDAGVAHGARLCTRNAEDLRGPQDLVDVVACADTPALTRLR